MAEQRIVALFEGVAALQNNGGSGDEEANQQVEILRQFAKVDWALHVEHNVLEEMEDRQLAARIDEGLARAMKTLNNMEIAGGAPENPAVEGAKHALVEVEMEADSPVESDEEGDGPVENEEFQWNLFDLRRYNVLDKIFSFISPLDRLNMALAFPGEGEFFNFNPPITEEHERLLPLILAGNIRDAMDLWYSSRVDCYFKAAINKHLDNVWSEELRSLEYASSRENDVPLEDVAGDDSQDPINFLVRIVSCRDNLRNVWDSLGTCGHRILHCDFKLFGILYRGHVLESFLQLMPNLKTLSVEGPDGCNGKLPHNYPDLPFLKSLMIVESNNDDMPFRRELLQKYGGQVETLGLRTYGDSNPPANNQVPVEGTLLSTLFFEIPKDTEDVCGCRFNILNNFAHCPLKVIDLRIPDIYFELVLILHLSHWTNSLEDLKLCLEPRNLSDLRLCPGHEEAVKVTTMLDLRFNKVKRLSTEGYPLSWKWALLLLFPELEELEYYPDQDEVEEDRDQSYMTVQPNKDLMLTSNIWKLLPKLNVFNFYADQQMNTVTRQECVDNQNA